MRVEFFPAAEQELTEAAEYYEARRQGLGTNFLAEIERTCAVLVECLRWVRSSIRSIVGCPYDAFRMH
jgi:hypothetical protein